MAIAVRRGHERRDASPDATDEELQEWFREATGRATLVEPVPAVPATPAVPEPIAPVRHARVGSRATKTIVGVIVSNLVVQFGVLAIGNAQHWDPTQALWAFVFVGVFYFAVIACVVALRSDSLGLRPVWLIGSAYRAVGVGFATGAIAALLLGALGFLASGHPVIDPVAGLLAGNENLAMLLAGFGLIAVFGPFVEELVFRGFFAEALRGRGRRAAILLSGVAFSAAHLRFAQFRYFLIMGIGFGTLYWGRGLVASIAAHATFNGFLILLAVASVHGPLRTHHADGLAVSLPATWQVAAHGTGSSDLTAIGPAGAGIAVNHVDLAAGVAIDVERLAAVMRSGALPPLPGSMVIDPNSVRVTRLPVGPALRVNATVRGHRDDVVMTVQGNQLVILEIVHKGSAQATRDFERMLIQLRT